MKSGLSRLPWSASKHTWAFKVAAKHLARSPLHGMTRELQQRSQGFSQASRGDCQLTLGIRPGSKGHSSVREFPAQSPKTSFAPLAFAWGELAIPEAGLREVPPQAASGATGTAEAALNTAEVLGLLLSQSRGLPTPPWHKAQRGKGRLNNLASLTTTWPFASLALG